MHTPGTRSHVPPLELLLDEAPLPDEEGGVVLADEAVQQDVLRLARDILRGQGHAAQLAAGVPEDWALFSRRDRI